MTEPNVFYGHPDNEHLSATSIAEAIDMQIEDCWPDIPDSVEVVKWVQLQVPWQRLNVLDDLLENLDETYGDPEDCTTSTQAMRDAEKVFIEAIKKDYYVWIHEPEGKPIIISVAYWLMQNRKLSLLLEAQRARNRRKIGLQIWSTKGEKYQYYG